MARHEVLMLVKLLPIAPKGSLYWLAIGSACSEKIRLARIVCERQMVRPINFQAFFFFFWRGLPFPNIIFGLFPQRDMRNKSNRTAFHLACQGKNKSEEKCTVSCGMGHKYSSACQPRRLARIPPSALSCNPPGNESFCRPDSAGQPFTDMSRQSVLMHPWWIY